MQILLNIIAILFRIFSNSFSNVFQKKLTKSGEAATCINCINYILMSLISIPLLLLVNFSLITPEFWLYAIAGGITGAIGNCFMVLALKQGELSVLGPINSYKAIVGMIFGIFLFGIFLIIPPLTSVFELVLLFVEGVRVSKNEHYQQWYEKHKKIKRMAEVYGRIGWILEIIMYFTCFLFEYLY